MLLAPPAGFAVERGIDGLHRLLFLVYKDMSPEMSTARLHFWSIEPERHSLAADQYAPAQAPMIALRPSFAACCRQTCHCSPPQLTV